MNKTCPGCGAIFQSSEPEKAGYIFPEKIKDALYCVRCFKMKNYHQVFSNDVNISNDQIIKEVNQSNYPVLFLTDLLNINAETIDWFKHITAPKKLIINKIDLIDKNIYLPKLVENIKKYYEINEDIYLYSAKKGLGTKKINDYLSSIDGKLFVVGLTNAGKSSFINNLLGQDYTVASYMTNMTLNFNEINLAPNLVVVDAPGFNYQNVLSTELQWDKLINKSKKIVPVTFQLKERMIINIHDFFYIGHSGQYNSMTIYTTNNIIIKRQFKEPAQSFVLIDIVANQDLIIKGLGFINIKQPGQLKLYGINENLLEVRPSIFRS